jgi:hypothetical protein
MSLGSFSSLCFPPTSNQWSELVFKKVLGGRCWWLMPVILATQEAEIWKIVVWNQFQANSLQDPILKIPNTKQGWKNGSGGRTPDYQVWAQTSVPPKKKKSLFDQPRFVFSFVPSPTGPIFCLDCTLLSFLALAVHGGNVLKPFSCHSCLSLEILSWPRLPKWSLSMILNIWV